ncbi:MAG: hypothetical protein JNL38_13205 [Myxococcales bacterium]|nr:hypothetical protein [Myxococcales bacterium]
MTKRPDDTDPSGAPDALVDELLGGAARIDIRADQSSSDGFENARYYAEASPASSRAPNRTEPMSNIIVERTPQPPAPPANLEPTAPPAAASRRELSPTEVLVRAPMAPSPLRRLAAALAGAAVVMGLGLTIVYVALGQRTTDATLPPATSTSATASASSASPSAQPPAPSSGTTTVTAGSTSAPRTAPTTSQAQPPHSGAAPRVAPSARATASSSSAEPSAHPTNPAPSASIRFGNFIQEDMK